LIVRGEPFTVESAIGTAAFGGVAGFLAFCVFKGGTQYFEVNDHGVYWRDAFAGSGRVQDVDVESFEIVQNIGGFDSQGISRVNIFLKSGAVVRIPSGCVQNEAEIYAILMTKWKFRGFR
jgi:hypothetical protein